MNQNKFCPLNCDGHGTCSNGACVCDSGYYGKDCHYPLVVITLCIPLTNNSTQVDNSSACTCSFPKTSLIVDQCICPDNDCSSAIAPTVDECSACRPNCLACTTVSTCTQCKSGYYISSQGYCVACSISGCMTCPDDQCTQCSSGSNEVVEINDDGTTNITACQSTCILGCIQCEDGSSSCKVCAIGYYLNTDTQGNTVCVSCNPSKTNCLSCTASDTCTQCATQYYLDNGACKSCPPGCATCTSTTNCLSCNDETYVLTASNQGKNTCVPVCPENCAQCSNPSSCKQCNTGYYWNSTSISCSSCPSLCTQCTGSNQCTSCLPGSYLETLNTDGTPKLCELCSLNCQTCSKVAVGNTTNYTLVCSECSNGYEIVDGYCIPEVLACGDNYYQNGIKCTPCMTGCKVCADGLGCLTSSDEYYLDIDYRVAQISFGVTIKAQNTIVNVPVRCPVPAKSCTSKSVMTSCETDYTLSDGKCSKTCSDGCKTCYDTGQCSECEVNYTWYENECFSCPSDCNTCEMRYNGTKIMCIECSGKYDLINGECTKKFDITGALGPVASFIVGTALVAAIIYVLRAQGWCLSKKKTINGLEKGQNEKVAKDKLEDSEFPAKGKRSMSIDDENQALDANVPEPDQNLPLESSHSESQIEDFKEVSGMGQPGIYNTKLGDDIFEIRKKGGFMNADMRLRQLRGIELSRGGSQLILEGRASLTPGQMVRNFSNSPTLRSPVELVSPIGGESPLIFPDVTQEYRKTEDNLDFLNYVNRKTSE